MNATTSRPALVALDWGTSALRAYRLGANGAILAQIDAPAGLRAIRGGAFEAAFRQYASPLFDGAPLPAIACGMIASKHGWMETPYLDAPAGVDDLATSLSRMTLADGRVLHFVTGLLGDRDGAPDVMRGEETQIFGALDHGAASGAFVAPGTHSKWVRVEEGRIQAFSTHMTGELFAALRDHTILGALIENAPFDRAAFLEGVAKARRGASGLANALFSVRTLPLMGHMATTQAGDYLSGLLIGAETRGALEAQGAPGPITLLGRDDLADRYQLALESFGLETRRAQPDVAAAGLFRIAKRAKLLR